MFGYHTCLNLMLKLNVVLVFGIQLAVHEAGGVGCAVGAYHAAYLAQLLFESLSHVGGLWC